MGCDDPHTADSSPLLHSVSRADPEQSPFQQVPTFNLVIHLRQCREMSMRNHIKGLETAV